MSRHDRITTKLTEGLTPTRLVVVDESHQHSVPKGAESHFNVVVATEAFEGMGRVHRHRRIHELLADELSGGLHALTLTLLTPAEDAARGGQGLASPKCLGGSKADAAGAKGP